MADQYVILRPNETIANNAMDGGTPHTVLSDNLDVSVIYGLAGAYWVVGHGTFAFPVGARIVCVYPIIRGKAETSATTSCKGRLYAQLAAETGPVGSISTLSPSNVNLGGGTWYTKANGQALSITDIDNIQAKFISDAQLYLSNNNRILCSEAYLYVYYNVRPTTVVTGPVEGSTHTATNSPAISWTYSDPEGDAQGSYRAKVFSAAQYGAVGFDPETSVATWDSGDVAGAATTCAGPSLVNGTYRAYVKTSDPTGFSLWDNNTFTIDVNLPGSSSSLQPGAPTLTVTEEAASARVRLDLVEGTSPAVDYFIIERSEDGGVTWEKVRDTTKILNTNLLPITAAENEAVGANGWTGSNQAATYPQSSIAQPFTGARGLMSRSAAAGDMAVVSQTVAVTPAVSYKIRAYSRPQTTARTFTARIRWLDAALTWTATSTGSGVLEVAADWREATVTGVAPAGMAFLQIEVIWTACAITEDHYLDTISAKPSANVLKYDYEVNRNLPAGMLKYRAQGFRYTAPTEVPLVTVMASPLTANIVGSLASDGFNWLKSPTNPALNIKVRFGFGSGEKLESSTEEVQAKYAPKNRTYLVVFGSNTEGEEFDLPLAFQGETEFAAFEVLRKRRETLLLQTRYGDADKKAIQYWLHLGTRTQTLMNTTVQNPVLSRRVVVHAVQVGKPPESVVAGTI